MQYDLFICQSDIFKMLFDYIDMMSRWHYVFVVLVALSAATLTIGTGADTVTYDDVDALELQPVGEANENAYVVENEDGELHIQVTGESGSPTGSGVNDNAVTDLGAVFTVENVFGSEGTSDEYATTHATVWVENDGGEAVTFYDADTGEPIETRDDGEELSPGDALSIGMSVDTTDETTPTISTLTVRADSTESQAPTEDDTASSFGSSSSSDDETAEDEDTAEEPSELPLEDDAGETEAGEDDAADESVASGLIELAGFGAPTSLAVIGAAGAILSLTYVYRSRTRAGGTVGHKGDQ